MLSEAAYAKAVFPENFFDDSHMLIADVDNFDLWFLLHEITRKTYIAEIERKVEVDWGLFKRNIDSRAWNLIFEYPNGVNEVEYCHWRGNTMNQAILQLKDREERNKVKRVDAWKQKSLERFKALAKRVPPEPTWVSPFPDVKIWKVPSSLGQDLSNNTSPQTTAERPVWAQGNATSPQTTAERPEWAQGSALPNNRDLPVWAQGEAHHLVRTSRDVVDANKIATLTYHSDSGVNGGGSNTRTSKGCTHCNNVNTIFESLKQEDKDLDAREEAVHDLELVMQQNIQLMQERELEVAAREKEVLELEEALAEFGIVEEDYDGYEVCEGDHVEEDDEDGEVAEMEDAVAEGVTWESNFDETKVAESVDG